MMKLLQRHLANKARCNHQWDCSCMSCRPGFKVIDMLGLKSFTNIVHWGGELPMKDRKEFARMVGKF